MNSSRLPSEVDSLDRGDRRFLPSHEVHRTRRSWYRSGLTEWTIWACAMCGIGIALGGWQLPEIILEDSSGITAIIVLMFAAALTKSLFDAVRLQRQMRIATQQTRELADSLGLREFLISSKTSLFRSHIQSLHSILMRDPNLSQDNLINVVHARLLARNKVVELLASILITLGLIGTIVGLTAVVGGMDSLLKGVDGGGEGSAQGPAGSLFEGMREIVGGLGTAFYTTLIGAVFGGVILRVLTSVVASNILRLVAHLSELTEVYVLPNLRQEARHLEASGYYDQPGARSS